MRTPSTPTGNAIAADNTAPAHLVQIGWSTVTRITSDSESLPWNGYVWVPADLEVSELKWENAGQQAATMRLGNASQQWSALALNDGAADVPIMVWTYDRSATATADPVLVFSGVGGRCGADEDTVTIELATQRANTLKSPRQRISRSAGYSLLPAAGTVIRWGNQRYVLAKR
jgi:hypothetical protein